VNHLFRTSLLVSALAISACGTTTCVGNTCTEPPADLDGGTQLTTTDAGQPEPDAGLDAGHTPDAGLVVATDGGTLLGASSCSASTPAGTSSFVSTTVGLPNTFHTAKTTSLGGCNGTEPHPGADTVFRFTVPPRQVITVAVQSLTGDGSQNAPLFDPVAYLVEPPDFNCTVQNHTSSWASCSSWSDASSQTPAALRGADALTWTNLSLRPVDVYVVIDSLRPRAPQALDLNQDGTSDFWVKGEGDFAVAMSTAPMPAAPTNDTCTGAIALTAGTLTGTTVSANSDLTFDVSADGCLTVSESQELGDVFYTATINPGQRLLLKATALTAEQTVAVNLFNDICHEVLVCKYDASPAPSPATAFWDNRGSTPLTIFIQVFTMNGQQAGGAFTLETRFDPIPSAPGNDTCSTATPLVAGNTLPNETTVGAAANLTFAQPNTCNDLTTQHDVFYSLTLPAQQRLVVTASTPDTDARLDLNLFTGACTNVASCKSGGSTANAPARAIRDNRGSTPELVMVQVSSLDSGAVGAPFSIGATLAPIPAAPANDVCGAALPLTPSTTTQGTFVGSAANSPLASGASQCSGRRTLADVFYSLTIPALSTATFTVTPVAGLDTAINILSSATACSGVSTCVGTDDRGYSGEADIASYRNTSNNPRTVLVQVMAFGGAEDTFSVNAVISP
jgi:hypothetical protein